MAGLKKCFIYVDDPLELKKYVHKSVEVETVDGEKLSGVVYTIDPVSRSIVLVSQSDGKPSMDVIIGHSVKSIAVTAECAEPKHELFSPTGCPGLSDAEIQQRKEKLKAWLVTNRFPVSEDGERLMLADALVISPPFGPDQCVSSNEIILGRVQNLISSMPPNFKA